MMNNFPQERKGLASSLASALCNATEFLTETKIGGITVGAVLLIVALFSAFMSYSYFDTPLIFYLLFIGVIAGNVAHIQICKREGLKQHLFWEMLRIAGVAIGVWFSETIFENSLLLGVIAIAIGAYAGDFVRALISKWHREA